MGKKKNSLLRKLSKIGKKTGKEFGNSPLARASKGKRTRGFI